MVHLPPPCQVTRVPKLTDLYSAKHMSVSPSPARMPMKAAHMDSMSLCAALPTSCGVGGGNGAKAGKHLGVNGLGEHACT